MTLPTVQMLWVRGPLSRLEQLSIASFLRNGHSVDLYSYEPPANVPAGANVLDARGILPESEVFLAPSREGFGSLAPFSDIFRFALLLEKGGIWCDTDVVCVKPLHFADSMESFFATEPVFSPPGTTQKQAMVASCAIKVPARSPLTTECLAIARGTDLASAPWGAIGPHLLNQLVPKHGLNASLLVPNVFCPFGFWHIDAFLSGITTLPGDCHAVHFWNEIWRRNFLDKNGIFAPHSLYERLKAYFLDRGES